MKRYAIENLIQWKKNKNRKPLIIQGARQVGKTWLMKEFGRLYYKETIYINFDNNKQLSNVFQDNINIPDIITALEILSGKKITAENSLLIFDEIQEIPNALKALKYFYEEHPEYHIICAGSLLGISISQNISFPVGKVDFLKLYPLSFSEFLEALNKEKLIEVIKNKNTILLNTFKDELNNLLKQYLYIGGMPEIVHNFSTNNDYKKARQLQKNILLSYEYDFGKHAPNNEVPRIRQVWESIPSQLAKENKKFVYGTLKEGARAKEYEIAIKWLCDTGLIYMVHNINNPEIPLSVYKDLKAFKIYMLDTGLLGAMANLESQTLLNNDIFISFKGIYAEQYAMQQLMLQYDKLYYYTNDRNSAEIEFLIEYNNKIIPIEVKAGINLKAKSLKTYIEKYHPEKALRFSLADYKTSDILTDIPLYAINFFEKYL